MRKIISLLLLIVLCIPVCTPVVSYAAVQNTVTLKDSTYSYYADGTKPEYNKHAIFTSNTGNPVFCGNHGLPSPVGDTLGDSKKMDMIDYDNETVRKILYYGYLGPKEWKGFSESKYNEVYKAGTTANKRVWCGIAVTGMALTKNQGYGYFYDVSGFSAFWEYIKTAPKPPKGFKSYIMYGNSSQQDLFTWTYNPEGNLSLIKSIDGNDKLVKECPEQYSLKGAKYIVSTDEKGKNKVGELTTKADGESNILTLTPGTYYVKESVAPKGYELDEETYKIKVEEDKDNCLRVKDKPILAYIDLLLKKVDSTDDTGLEGAVFKVNYYKELTSDPSGLTPAKSWELRTGVKGEIALSDEYKVSGDDFYKDEDGKPVGLIGTYEFVEVKAPFGYAKNNESIVKQVRRDELSGTLEIYSAPKVSNIPQTISIILQKIEKEGVNETDLKPNFEGAVYEVRNSKDEVVGTIITESSGFGRIDNLAPDQYRIIEKEAPSGYLINSEEIIVNATPEDDKLVNYEFYVETLENPTTVEVLKYEMIGDKKTPLKGATIQIINGNGEVVYEYITTEEAQFIKKLPVGEYILREINAPEGYLLAEDVTFSIDEYTEIVYVEMENKKRMITQEEPKPDIEDEKPKEDIKKPVKEPETEDVKKLEEKKDIPETGDYNKLYLYFSFMVISVIGLGYIISKKYLKKY